MSRRDIGITPIHQCPPELLSNIFMFLPPVRGLNETCVFLVARRGALSLAPMKPHKFIKVVKQPSQIGWKGLRGVLAKSLYPFVSGLEVELGRQIQHCWTRRHRTTGQMGAGTWQVAVENFNFVLDSARAAVLMKATRLENRAEEVSYIRM